MNNWQKKTSIVLIPVLIILGIVLAGIIYIARNVKITRGPSANLEKSDLFKKPQEMREIMATVAPKPKPDFTADGNLHLRNEGEENESWTLLYEEPEKPAVIAYLTFNFRSQCDFGSGEQICNTKKLENGLRVYVEGTKNGNDVAVIKLAVLE